MRGEVWWVQLAGAAGRRPALVLTRDPTADRIGYPSVAACTTTRRGLGSEVPLGLEDGMPRPCVVNLDNISTTPRDAFASYICTLRDAKMAEVCAALRFALGC